MSHSLAQKVSLKPSLSPKSDPTRPKPVFDPVKPGLENNQVAEITFFSQDSDTVLPYWKKECPPIDLCYPNIRQKQAIKPYSKNCKVDGANAPDASCCTNGRFLIDFGSSQT